MHLQPDREVPDLFRVIVTARFQQPGIQNFAIEMKTGPVELIRHAGRVELKAEFSVFVRQPFDLRRQGKRHAVPIRIQPQLPEIFDHLRRIPERNRVPWPVDVKMMFFSGLFPDQIRKTFLNRIAVDDIAANRITRFQPDGKFQHVVRRDPAVCFDSMLMGKI